MAKTRRSTKKKSESVPVELELALLNNRLAKLEETTGGFWRTAHGHLMALRQMSDGHLRAARQHAIETKQLTAVPKLSAEIERREIDRAYTQAQNRGTGSSRTRVRLEVSAALAQIRKHLPIEQVDVVRRLETLLDEVLP